MKFPQPSQEYEELKTFSAPWGICYGPIQSRRLGQSLGINLSGSDEKICSFDCIYCELGRTNVKMSQIKKIAQFPTLENIDKEVRQFIVDLTKRSQKFDFICISGNGEPTLHPDFEDVARLTKKIRDDLVPDVKTAILSNGATLDNSKTVRGMNHLDQRMIKIDAGNDNMLTKLDSPLVRLTVAKLLQGIKKLKDLTVQSYFSQGIVDNTIPSEIDDWIEVVGIVKPKLVHIYSLDRVPPVTGLKPVPYQKLKEISVTLQRRTGIKSVVFS